MNATVIKLIAMIIMLIDHMGAILFPKVPVLRAIGRLAFPIFAYFITEGYIKTRNVERYMKRLFIFALVSQVPFYLAFKHKLYFNIFFTLFLGLWAIKLYDEKNNLNYIILIGILAQVINTDYGIYGILTIYFFYKYHHDFKNMVKSQVLLNIIFSGVIFVLFIIASLQGGSVIESYFKVILQCFLQCLSILSLLLIKYYNGERGRSIKYLFYTFYPAHLFILWLIKIL